MPEVGLFWLIDNKLVADSIPWRQGDVYGGFYGGKSGHAALWTRCSGLCPNGRVRNIRTSHAARVLFDSMEEVFLVYSSRLLINSLEVRKMILAEFNLPLAATKFAADYHYENAIVPLLDEGFDGSHA